MYVLNRVGQYVRALGEAAPTLLHRGKLFLVLTSECKEN